MKTKLALQICLFLSSAAAFGAAGGTENNTNGCLYGDQLYAVGAWVNILNTQGVAVARQQCNYGKYQNGTQDIYYWGEPEVLSQPDYSQEPASTAPAYSSPASARTDCYQQAYSASGLNLSESQALYLCAHSYDAAGTITCFHQAYDQTGLNLSLQQSLDMCR
jgi:hypothetical protein